MVFLQKKKVMHIFRKIPHIFRRIFSVKKPVMDENLTEKFSRDLVFVNEVRKWEDLQTDCLVNIFERLDMKSLIEHLPLVCKSWYNASLDPQCWKVLDFSYLETELYEMLTLEQLSIKLNCGLKLAVYRSCGKASKVVFPLIQLRSCDEDIVQYVLGRCAELKSLVLPNDENYENFIWLPKQIYIWKDLQSLSLHSSCHLKEILTEIHIHCKKFYSLTVRCEITTEIASAIVTFVPDIKQLVLNHCDLDREDLMLILSGCRELELLDATDCDGFDAYDVEILTMASHIKTFMSEGSAELGTVFYTM